MNEIQKERERIAALVQSYAHCHNDASHCDCCPGGRASQDFLNLAREIREMTCSEIGHTVRSDKQGLHARCSYCDSIAVWKMPKLAEGA
jgi:hypothetical protein